MQSLKWKCQFFTSSKLSWPIKSSARMICFANAHRTARITFVKTSPAEPRARPQSSFMMPVNLQATARIFALRVVAGAACYSSIATDQIPSTSRLRSKLINILPLFTVPSSGGNSPLGPVRPGTRVRFCAFHVRHSSQTKSAKKRFVQT